MSQIVVTKELDLSSFLSGIFMFDANLLSPVVICPKKSDSQSLQDFFEEQKTPVNLWASYAGVAGIAQYSLKKGTPTGALARLDAHFRFPTEEEMQTDFENFGEQVLGPSLAEVSEEKKENYKCNGVFTFFGQPHYFVGPPRLVASLFYCRVFQGNLPKDISDLVREIDGLAESGEMIVPQGYHFLHSRNGELKHSAFQKPEEYDPSKLKKSGFVELTATKMIYYPTEDRTNSLDYTPVLQR